MFVYALPAFDKSFLPLSPHRSHATEVDWMSVIHRSWSVLPSPPLLRYFCILERMMCTGLQWSALGRKKCLEDNISDWILLLQIQEISVGESEELDGNF